MSHRTVTPTELGEAMIEYARRGPTTNVPAEPGLPLPSMFDANERPVTADEDGLPLPSMSFDDIRPRTPLTNNGDEVGLPLPVMTFD